MAKIMIDNDGEKHLEGSSLCDLETMCGRVWTDYKYEYAEGTPDCCGCIDAVKQLLKDCTLKELKELVKSP